ncbi:bicarbonate transport system permease protein CmpB [bacterium BMS3Bbin06]|nr:bicarbonate transport system permease protein CmpB [bacterium BMS3Abin08]GBE34586.1 bicarbonate transport system permease protein CmpB [bacterium BMS3Bbin06]
MSMNFIFPIVVISAFAIWIFYYRQKKLAFFSGISTGEQIRKTLTSQRFWLLILGFVLTIGFWYVAVYWLPFKAFHRLPGPDEVITEWLSRDPYYGISIYTKEYYVHILYSTYRATTAFVLATVLGVPFGLIMGWNRRFYEYSFPLVEMIRPIPPLAWVPLAILMLPGSEPAVIFVTFLVAFFVTALNTLLGVQSIDEAYFRAARCLGASSKEILYDVVIPGSLPFIFTGLQIAMGAAWFSLVAGEMIAAQYGLGYLIWQGYSLVKYPTIIIGMLTLGIIGYISSVAIRYVGKKLMAWREQDLSGSGATYE